MTILFGLIKVNMFTVDSMPLNKRNQIIIIIIIAPIIAIVIPLNPIKKKLTLENS